MNTNTLAKNIREEVQRHKEETARYLLAQQNLIKKCNHKFVIITRSYYHGSYSYDYEDGHPECRTCIVCGEHESHDKKENFKRLLNPFIRLELQYSESDIPNYDKNKEDKKKFYNITNYKLTDLIKTAKKIGYPV